MKPVYVAGLALLLSACGYSVDQLAEDHELRKKILAECADMGMASKDEEKCEIAMKAQAEATRRTAKELFSGE